LTKSLLLESLLVGDAASRSERGGRDMSIWLPEPTAINIGIESRIETLRGHRLRGLKSRLPRRN